ncbi:MAG: hypothetical protein AAF556_06955, partial [Pseudomonadota bacterium]
MVIGFFLPKWMYSLGGTLGSAAITVTRFWAAVPKVRNSPLCLCHPDENQDPGALNKHEVGRWFKAPGFRIKSG